MALDYHMKPSSKSCRGLFSTSPWFCLLISIIIVCCLSSAIIMWSESYTSLTIFMAHNTMMFTSIINHTVIPHLLSLSSTQFAAVFGFICVCFITIIVYIGRAFTHMMTHRNTFSVSEECDKTYEDLQRELTQGISAIEDVENRVEGMFGQLEDASVVSDELHSLNSCLGSIDTSKQGVNEVRQCSIGLSLAVIQAQQENLQLADQILNLQAQLDGLANQRSSDLEMMDKKHLSMSALLSRAQVDMQTQKHAFDALAAEANNDMSIRFDLHREEWLAQLNCSRSKCISLESEVSSYKTSHRVLQDNLQKRIIDIATLKASVRELTNDVNDLRSEKEKLIDENQRLILSREAAKQDIGSDSAEAKRCCDVLDDRVEESVAQMSELQNKLDTAQARIEECIECEDELDDARIELHYLRPFTAALEQQFQHQIHLLVNECALSHQLQHELDESQYITEQLHSANHILQSRLQHQNDVENEFIDSVNKLSHSRIQLETRVNTQNHDVTEQILHQIVDAVVMAQLQQTVELLELKNAERAIELGSLQCELQRHTIKNSHSSIITQCVKNDKQNHHNVSNTQFNDVTEDTTMSHIEGSVKSADATALHHELQIVIADKARLMAEASALKVELERCNGNETWQQLIIAKDDIKCLRGEIQELNKVHFLHDVDRASNESKMQLNLMQSQRDVDTLQTQLSHSTQKLIELKCVKTEMKSISSTLFSRDAELKRVKNELNSLQKQYENTESELMNVNNKIVSLNLQLCANENEFKSLNTRSASLTFDTDFNAVKGECDDVKHCVVRDECESMRYNDDADINKAFIVVEQCCKRLENLSALTFNHNSLAKQTTLDQCVILETHLHTIESEKRQIFAQKCHAENELRKQLESVEASIRVERDNCSNAVEQSDIKLANALKAKTCLSVDNETLLRANKNMAEQIVCVTADRDDIRSKQASVVQTLETTMTQLYEERDMLADQLEQARVNTLETIDNLHLNQCREREQHALDKASLLKNFEATSAQQALASQKEIDDTREAEKALQKCVDEERIETALLHENMQRRIHELTELTQHQYHHNTPERIDVSTMTIATKTMMNTSHHVLTTSCNTENKKSLANSIKPSPNRRQHPLTVPSSMKTPKSRYLSTQPFTPPSMPQSSLATSKPLSTSKTLSKKNSSSKKSISNRYWTVADFKFVREISRSANNIGTLYLVTEVSKVNSSEVRQYAVKKICRPRLMRSAGAHQRILQMIDLNGRLRHRNLVRLFGSFEDSKFVYLVFEYIKDAACLQQHRDRLLRRQHLLFPTNDVAFLLEELANVLSYIHSKGFVHTGVNADNILISADSIPRLVGLDNAIAIDASAAIAKRCARRISVPPPELLNGGRVTEAVDSWCIGVLAFSLLSGYEPFEGKKGLVSCENIGFPLVFDGLARELIEQLLLHEPDQRLTMSQVLCHPFIITHKHALELSNTEA